MLRAQRWRWVSWETLGGPGMAGDHVARLGEEGSVGGGEQLLQLTSGWPSYPAGH